MGAGRRSDGEGGRARVDDGAGALETAMVMAMAMAVAMGMAMVMVVPVPLGLSALADPAAPCTRNLPRVCPDERRCRCPRDGHPGRWPRGASGSMRPLSQLRLPRLKHCNTAPSAKRARPTQLPPPPLLSPLARRNRKARQSVKVCVCA